MRSVQSSLWLLAFGSETGLGVRQPTENVPQQVNRDPYRSRVRRRAPSFFGLTALLCIPLLFAAPLAWKRAQEQQAAIRTRRASWERMVAELKREIRAFPGQSGIVVEDLSTGWRFTHQPDRRFAAASIIKVPVMGAAFTAEKAGRLKLDEQVTLRGADQTNGSGILKAEKPGAVFPVSRLLELMISQSDNTATNILLSKIGMEYANKQFGSLGLRNTTLRRKMMDFSQRDKGVENYTTASDMAEILKRLYRGKVVNPRYSEQGLDWMRHQKLNDRIPAKLPKGTVVAHKTGLERSVCHDVGIVYTDGGDLLICVLTRHKGLSGPAKRYIASLSRHAYDYLPGDARP